MKRKITAVLLIIFMLTGMLPLSAFAEEPLEPVPYYDPVEGKIRYCTQYEKVEYRDFPLSPEETWYVVTSNATAAQVIQIYKGDVNIILCDGATLNAPYGINISGGSSLTVWAQSDGDDMGTLNATGSGGCLCGIGNDGDYVIQGGIYSVTINGGNINAVSADFGSAPAIGTGHGDTIGSITVNGGRVTATCLGKRGAGIGSSNGSTNRIGIESINITGGTVTATGGDGAAGIGGTDVSGCSNIIITGGTINATGGSWAPGIGNLSGDECNITIGSCDITATAGEGAAAIGGYAEHPEMVHLDLYGAQAYASTDVTTPVTAYERLDICNSSCARLAPCTSHSYQDGYCEICGARAEYIYFDPDDGSDPYKIPDSYTQVTGLSEFTTGWYTVPADTALDSRVRISGDVNLILRDNTGLTVPKGFEVPESSTLTIWTQCERYFTGSLKITGPDDNCAGIGGNYGENCGTVIIKNGDITVKGGSGAAGIGGGYGGNGGSVTVLGGTVKSAAGAGAEAIGCGSGGSSSGTVTFSDYKAINTDIPGSDPIEADERITACRGAYVKLEPCDHHQNDHLTCDWCGKRIITPEYYDPTNGNTNTLAEFAIFEDQTELTGGWYVVLPGTFDVDSAISVLGDVDLLLFDGAVLNANAGITVTQGNSLTVWGQNSLYGEAATHGTGVLNAANSGGAAIGCGDKNTSAGNIVINGGVINAQDTKGAGIGTSSKTDSASVTIRDGTVTATGGSVLLSINKPSNAGISIGSNGTVSISGGYVRAEGGSGGAGIGGWEDSDCGTVTITGGSVTAIGGSDAAGIGGGRYGNGGIVSISGGTLCVTAEYPAHAIGCGRNTGTFISTLSDGTLDLADMRVGTVSGDTVTWASPENYVTVCQSYGTVRIEKTPHSVTVVNYIENGTVRVSAREAIEGVEITLSADPADGYELDRYVVIDADSVPVPVYDGEFAMPPSDVTVNAVFTPIQRPKISAHAMVLASEIGVKYKVVFPPGYDKSNVCMDFEVDDGRMETMQVLDENEINENACWFICYLNPLEIADLITAKLYNGGTLILEDRYYCAEAYAYSAKNLYKDDSTLLALLSSLQDYGYAMHKSGWEDSFGIGKHRFIDHSETYSYTIGMRNQCIQEMENMVLLNRSLTDSGISKLKYSLTLNSDIKLSVYLFPENDAIFIDDDGFTEMILGGERCYRYVFEKIPIINLGSMCVVSVVPKETAASTNSVAARAGATVEVSPLYYLYKAITDTSGVITSEKSEALCALYNYYKAAVAYKAAHNSD